MKLIISLAVVLLLSVAEADVGLKCSYYNSQDELSEELCGENISFESFEALMPDSMLYKDSGQSTTTESSYAYSINHNGEELRSSAITDSGSFSWGAAADFNYYGPDSQSFALNAKNYVKDGNINASYGNPGVEVCDRVEAVNAEFSETVKITPSSLSSEGSGGTIEVSAPSSSESPSAGSQITEGSEALEEGSVVKGFRQDLKIQGQGRHGQIAADVMGNTECIWKSSVKADLPSLSFGMAVRGTCSGAMESLGMIGMVSDYPTQILPPGVVDINSNPTSSSGQSQDVADSGIDNRLERIENETEEFRERYDLQSSEALWYYIDQTSSVTMTGSGSSVSGNLPNERYLMRMGFLVDPEQA